MAGGGHLGGDKHFSLGGTIFLVTASSVFIPLLWLHISYLCKTYFLFTGLAGVIYLCEPHLVISMLHVQSFILKLCFQ